MAYLIGTDEAGYAPNLGPLVISATVWEVDDARAGDDLYRTLRKAVCACPSRANGRRAAWGDSKALYKAGQGLATLERGILSALALAGTAPEDWRSLWLILDRDAADLLDEAPWHADYARALPIEADAADLARLVPRMQAAFAEAGVRLLAIRSRAVFPEEFNRCCEHYGNKAEALSTLTLNLAAQCLDGLEGAPVFVFCDKHGGRNRYSALLQRRFPDSLIEIHGEGREESVYRWGSPPRRVEARFRVQSERFLPAALASMASKYLREMAMLAFNDYWCGRVPSLRPTAGYPGDSRRWKAEVAAVQSELGIDDRILWRAK